jgi:hypothetical protein
MHNLVSVSLVLSLALTACSVSTTDVAATDEATTDEGLRARGCRGTEIVVNEGFFEDVLASLNPEDVVRTTGASFPAPSTLHVPHVFSVEHSFGADLIFTTAGIQFPDGVTALGGRPDGNTAQRAGHAAARALFFSMRGPATTVWRGNTSFQTRSSVNGRFRCELQTAIYADVGAYCTLSGVRSAIPSTRRAGEFCPNR